jgi:hypothetical protein
MATTLLSASGPSSTMTVCCSIAIARRRRRSADCSRGPHLYRDPPCRSPGATLWPGVCLARLDRRRRLVRGPGHRLSWCHHRCQYGGRGRQRGHPRFAVQCGGSRKSLSRHQEAMKQPRATEAPRIVVPSRAIYGKFVRIITTEVLEQFRESLPKG